MAQFTITASNITTNSATIELTSEIAHTAASSVDVTVVSSNGVEAYAGTTTIPVGTIGDVISVPVTGLKSNMEYTVTAKTGTTYTDTGTFTTTDDPTARTATQSQWEDLADKVEAASVAQSTFTDLTSADCNANRSNWSDTDPANFNCIAMWKLAPGIYTISDKTVNVFLSKSYSGTGEIDLVIVKDALPRDGDFNQYKLIYAFNSTRNIGNNIMGPSQRWVISSGQNEGFELQSNIYTRTALTTYNIATTYTQIESAAYFPNMVAGLNAVNQYVQLRIKKDTTAPTTSTPGEVGTLYSYVDSGTNTPHLYSCTDTTGGTYTWVQLI